MDDPLDEHISQIATRWTLVRRAMSPLEPDAQAVEALLLRYCGATWRFLHALVRDRDAADDLFQEFAARMVQSAFRNADPARGRFRDYLKRCLRNLATDHQRQRQKRRADGDAALEFAAAPDDADLLERDFEQHFRDDLMRQAWEALDLHDRGSGKHYALLLRRRTLAAAPSSAELAEEMTRATGDPWTSALVDKAVFRARRKFADLLLDCVAATLRLPGRAEMEEELAGLGLLSFCADAVQRRFGPAP